MSIVTTITSLSPKLKLAYAAVAVAVIAAVIIGLQYLSQAASYAAFVEAESGSRTGTAKTVTDPDTAGGAYLQFGGPVSSPSPSPSTSPSPSPTPTPPATGPILWQDKFDAAPAGQLTKVTGDAVFAPTVAPTNTDTYAMGSIVNDGPDGKGKALRHRIPAGQLGPFIVSPKLAREATHATIQYSIRFDKNFDWRWGGKMGPGLVGVDTGVGIYKPTSGNGDRNIGWSARLMWHGRGDDGSRPFQGKLGPIPQGRDNDVVTYLYSRYPKDGFSGYGWHTSVGSMLRDTWQTVKLEVKMNTVGKQDGVFKVWIDGALGYSATNFDWRSKENIRIQAIMWDIHRGGGTTPPSWVSSRDTYVDIADVVVREVQ